MDRAKYFELRRDLAKQKKLPVNALMLALDGVALFVAAQWLSGSNSALYWLAQFTLAIVGFHAFAYVHECGHGTFSENRAVNFIVGHIASVFCLMPFYSWKHLHADHHLWSGNLDRDPTLQGLKRLHAEGKSWRSRVLAVSWKLWIPVIALNQLLLVWGYQPENQRKRIHCNLSSLFVGVAFATGLLWWPLAFSPLHLMPAFVLFLGLCEAVNLPHHMGLALLRGEDRYRLWEQTEVTRTGCYPPLVAELLFVNFNFHVEHHLFPDAPWFRLRKVRKRLCDAAGREYHETNGVGWAFSNRRKPVMEAFAGEKRGGGSSPTPRWKRHLVRLIGRLVPWLPQRWRHAVYRQSISLNFSPSPRLRIKLAETREEWEAAFGLLYDAYLKSGLTGENPWKMRVTKYHALPTTTTIIALWDEKIVGTLSIVQDSSVKLPMDAIFDLAACRSGGKSIAELSALAIREEFHADAGKIIFPLLKFMWEYTTRYLGLDTIVAAVHPKMSEFYQAILMMKKVTTEVVPTYAFANNRPAVGLVLDFAEAQSECYRVYCGKPRSKDIYRYFKGASFSQFVYPDRKFFKSFDARLRGELLSHFLTQQSNVWEQMPPDERRLIEGNGTGYEKRYPARLRAKIRSGGFQTEVVLKNVSEGGLLAHFSSAFTIPVELLELIFPISAEVQVRLKAEPVWTREGKSGLRIVDKPAVWLEYISFLERDAA